jgi:pyridoxal phosphate enzyme (YggS family)
MSEVAAQLGFVQKQLPPHCILVAVSKTQPIEKLMEAYNAGQRVFGENRVQELCDKQPLMPHDTQWHQIGTLQSNKVKYIAPFISCIHSIDQIKLLEVVDKEAQKCGRIISCLLQVHIAQEDTKHGFSHDELLAMLEEGAWRKYIHISIDGLMGMASFSDDINLVRGEFKQLNLLFKQVKELYFKEADHFKHISMGMSGDYLTAVEEGSTMVRVGSLIFSHRN